MFCGKFCVILTYHKQSGGCAMAGNASLNKANIAKQDEFYTQLSDIEKELRHYRRHFKGKTVLCNCDDPFESNFFKYFVLNFNRLGLKKLISTCYAGSPIANRQLSLFDVLGEREKNENQPYKAVVTQVYDKTGDGGVDMYDVAELFRSGENLLTQLDGDGDFRSPECLRLLDEADIVVTNPPFSLLREYVAVLMEHEKKFIIIGPQNSLHYKEIFPLIRDNKMWLGYGFEKGDAYFSVPKESASGYAAGVYNAETGLVHFRNCVWLTNLDIKKRHELMIFARRYQPEKYPAYDNFDGIDVSTIAEIPSDFGGIMGVPDTFLQQYNPDQFQIIGIGSGILAKEIGVKKNYRGRTDIAYTIDGVHKCPYSRILIRNLHPEEAKNNDNSGT